MKNETLAVFVVVLFVQIAMIYIPNTHQRDSCALDGLHRLWGKLPP